MPREAFVVADIEIPEFAAILVLIAPGNTVVTPTFVPFNSDRRPSVS